ncbi:helix-turn-helix domain-containing protein [Tsukamurella tyrosinosolvens]|nr:helix-turn-helix domain-containing protein [Tsukamurella tyrosinosolvens]KXP04384.1 hypothetical protein AXK59_13170 [Tsukamurella tyrosinosolvens]KZL97623.1 hypothetical protein AXX05_01290 [Tsukamurella tyrosinosolvens]MCA4995774.1 helix-turn-helix domain-containing protein [Tsukamurella tyrosinosolvens]QRY83805.1 helix-turn-helix domain-containing protein [Tsukamurella tyrosinosolvens]
MDGTGRSIGSRLRRWRERRRRSQLDVALAAGVSTRHLSCLETGRALPSRSMIERLAEELEIPLRERNGLYVAAGFAPVHAERPWRELGAAAEALSALLRAHEPYPAVAIDVRWNVVDANAAMRRFLDPVPPAVAGPPLNMLRATLHPDGLAGSLIAPHHWRANALRRARRQLDRTADQELAELIAELETYPIPEGATPVPPPPAEDIVVPLRVDTEAGVLSLLYTVTVFGAPRDVTLDEIAIETMLPADGATRRILAAMAGA